MLLMQIVNTNSSIFSFQLEHSKYAHLNEQLAEASLRLRSVLLTFFFKKKMLYLRHLFSDPLFLRHLLSNVYHWYMNKL